jgi:hypothetical protein
MTGSGVPRLVIAGEWWITPIRPAGYSFRAVPASAGAARFIAASGRRLSPVYCDASTQ